MYSAKRVRSVCEHLSYTQADLAAAVGISESQAGRWCREGITNPHKTDAVARFAAMESSVPPDDPFAHLLLCQRIAGALPDLKDSDLAAILADVKRRQLAVLLAEFPSDEERGAAMATRSVAAGRTPEQTQRSEHRA